jgi:hypothetical protein
LEAGSPTCAHRRGAILLFPSHATIVELNVVRQVEAKDPVRHFGLAIWMPAWLLT